MTRISLNRIYYPVEVLGYGKRLGVWFQGCPKRCRNCMSPEMQTFSSTSINIDELIAMIPSEFAPDGMTISGGEPFAQPAALHQLVEWFVEHYNQDVLIYTGYLISELRDMHNPDIDWVLTNIAALVDGPYMMELDNNTGCIGSSNQKVHIFRYKERYQYFDTMVRHMQAVDEKDHLFLIGVAAHGS